MNWFVDADVIELEVELPTGDVVRIPVDRDRYVNDQAIDKATGTPEIHRTLQYTLEWVLSHQDVVDEVDIFYVEEFAKNPERVPFVFQELV